MIVSNSDPGATALETLVNVTRPATAGLCSLARLSRTPAAGARARTFPTLVDIILRQTRLFPTLIERISASDLEVADSSIELLDQLLLGSVDTADSRIPDELESLEVWRAIAVRRFAYELASRTARSPLLIRRKPSRAT